MVDTPRLAFEMDDGATLADLYDEVGRAYPELDGAVRAVLPVLRGTHIAKRHVLEHGDEVALLPRAAGG
jgi:molybdopterin converting factor small subunit